MSDPKPDPLDDLEARLVESNWPWDTSSWPERLATDPPRLDPDEPRRSLAELLALAGQQPSLPETASSRLGWQLTGHPGEADARALPTLAAALGSADTDIQRAFPNLDLLDHGLWLEVDSLSQEDRVHRWLCTPGRRLVTDLDLLQHLRGSQSQVGATALDWAALTQAAGVDKPQRGDATTHSHRWLDLHRAIPGEALSTWAPLDDDPALALFALDRSEVGLVRGAALAWLLDRAATSPVVSLGEIRRDLREELPSRLAVLLAPDGPAARHAKRHEKVEALCLLHASLIAQTRKPDAPPSQVWHVGRWIHAIVLHNPFYGGEPETVAARLSALVPADDPLSRDGLPALHPARFAGEDAVSLWDFSLLAGLIQHRRRFPASMLSEPVLRWLERLAQQPLSQADRDMDRAHLQANDDLGWPEPHVSPTQLARMVLTNARIPWLKQADDVVQGEVLKVLGEVTQILYWPVTALLEERGALHAGPAASAIDLWVQDELHHAPPWVLPGIGVSLLEHLDASQGERLLEQICGLDPEWRLKLLRLFYERAPAEIPAWAALVEQSLRALVQVAEDPDAPNAARSEAARHAVKLARRHPDQNADVLSRLARIVATPPLSQSPSLISALRALGYSVRRGAS